ncbi:MAG: hypothetical protein WD711_06910 [Dongiaceae bacterium]
MIRTTLAIAFMATLTTPALAQTECQQEANAIMDAVEASQLTQDQKGQVGSMLDEAQSQSQTGDEESCQATVD